MFTSAISSFLLCLLLLFLHSPCAMATAEPIYQECGQTGNYTAKSAYKSNLNLLLSSLTSNGSRFGFSATALGQSTDRVYGLVLCRGDTNATDCSSCLGTAAEDILLLCPDNKDANIWYDACLLRFSDRDFLSSTAYSPTQYLYNNENVTDPDRFDELVIELMDKISDWAAYNSTRRFATGEAMSFTPAFPTIYGLVQCTPDLSGAQCRQCLRVSMDKMENITVIKGKQGARAIGVRCSLRYEAYSFFNGAPTLRLAPPSAMVPAPEPKPEPVPGPSRNSSTLSSQPEIKTMLKAFVLLLMVSLI